MWAQSNSHRRRILLGFILFVAAGVFLAVNARHTQKVRVGFSVCQQPVFRNEDYIWFSYVDHLARPPKRIEVPAITNSHFLTEIIITNIGTIAIEPTSGRKPFYVLSVET